MRTLAIDSATEACSAALFEDGRMLAGRYEVIGRGHVERLVPMIAELPDKGRAERIVVSLGPGSFTGVRIGLAAARALGIAWNAEVSGYPTLALVAAMAIDANAAPVSVAMTGGHGEWFVQNFTAEGAAEGERRSLPPDEAAAFARSERVAGSKAVDLVERRGFGSAVELLPDARQFLSMQEYRLTDNIAPLYGRAPDAKLPGVPA